MSAYRGGAASQVFFATISLGGTPSFTTMLPFLLVSQRIAAFRIPAPFLLAPAFIHFFPPPVQRLRRSADLRLRPQAISKSLRVTFFRMGELPFSHLFLRAFSTYSLYTTVFFCLLFFPCFFPRLATLDVPQRHAVAPKRRPLLSFVRQSPSHPFSDLKWKFG